MSDLIPHYLTWLSAGGSSARTVSARWRCLRHADAHLPHGLDSSHTTEIATYLADPAWSRWTRHTYFGHLTGYYRWAYASGELSLDPTASLRRPPEGDRCPNPITDAELAHLLDAAPRWPWRAAFILAAYAGLRVSEVASLRRQDVTPAVLRVRGKGGLVACVDTHPMVWQLVDGLPPGPVVRDPDGSPLTGAQLTNRAGYLFRRLGLPEVRMHRLRHWYGTSLLAEGADLETVRQCLRHASIVSTIGYTQIGSPARRAAVHRLRAVGHGPAAIRPVSAAEAA